VSLTLLANCGLCKVTHDNTVIPFTALASGGSGSYTYQWRIYEPWGAVYALGTASTQDVNLTCFDQGEVRVEVTVTSGAQQATAAKPVFVTIPDCSP
jgi:hypothetical protein